MELSSFVEHVRAAQEKELFLIAFIRPFSAANRRYSSTRTSRRCISAVERSGSGIRATDVLRMSRWPSLTAMKAFATGALRTAARLLIVHSFLDHIPKNRCEQTRPSSSGVADNRQGPRDNRAALRMTLFWLHGRSNALRRRSGCFVDRYLYGGV